MGLSCVQRWSQAEKTVSSTVESTKTVNEHEVTSIEAGRFISYFQFFLGRLQGRFGDSFDQFF